jgi:iron complex transport system ATP-binding protein
VNREPAAETRGLAVGYRGRRGRRVVLDHLDLRIDEGRLVCLLGPNGSGKSTLLRTLAGMQPPLDGTALLRGDDVTRLGALERARRLSVVLTDPVDVGLMRATDFVALGRYPYTTWTGRLTARDRAVVRWALDVTGTAAFADRSVAELSDGERQRVHVARALAQQPALLALDEPVAFLDVPHRVELVQLLRRLARQGDLGVLVTTHDLDLAIRFADVVWLIEAGEAGRVHVGAPEDLVLDGRLATAFAGAGVRFDADEGRFVPLTAGAATARVVGEGPAARWAVRALERVGFAVVTDGAAVVTVEADGGERPRWRVVVDGVPASEHACIGDLVEAVSVTSQRPTPPAAPVAYSRPSGTT